MARRLKRLTRRLGGSTVEEAASCARALAVLLGPRPISSLLPDESARITRALLTHRVITALGPVPWPSAMTRQLDPADPAFLPPLGMHMVLSARDRTLLALPGRPRKGWVDPLGWAGFDGSPSVCVWFADGRTGYPIGPLPGTTGNAGNASTVEQVRSDDGHGVLTTCRRDGLSVEVFHWPVVLQGQVALAVFAQLSLDAPAPRPVRLGFAIRPAGIEGVEPIFSLDRSGEGMWRADGTPILVLALNGNDVLIGKHGQEDPWRRFSGLSHTGARHEPGPITIGCGAGLARATEVYRTTLTPGEPFSRFAVIAPPPEAPPAVVRTSGRTLWKGAIADRRGLLASGATIELTSHQRLLDAARQRVLVAPERLSLAGCLAAVALARLGFVRRAGQRIGGWMSRVRRDGKVLGASGEEAAMLGWAAAEYIRWTGERNWVREHLTSWTRLLNRLTRQEPKPGGHALFGPDGSVRWTRIWRTAALLAGAAALREVTDDHQRWGLAGGREREALPEHLGEAPWSANPGRAADGASAGMLCAAWLGLIPVRSEAVQTTVRYIQQHHWYGGGVFSRGGAHPAATALLMAVLARIEPDADPLGVVASLASNTGAFPSAHHPQRGALGEGDNLLGSAMFLLLALDAVQIEKRTLRVTSGIRCAIDLPTPFGRIDIQDGKVVGRWSGSAPEVIGPDQG